MKAGGGEVRESWVVCAELTAVPPYGPKSIATRFFLVSCEKFYRIDVTPVVQFLFGTPLVRTPLNPNVPWGRGIKSQIMPPRSIE